MQSRAQDRLSAVQKQETLAPILLSGQRQIHGGRSLDRRAKLGRVNMAEQLRFAGKILSARISKTADWWFVSLAVEMPEVVPEANAKPAVGVDVGLLRLATLSDGRRYENQRPLRHLLKKLR